VSAGAPTLDNQMDIKTEAQQKIESAKAEAESLRIQKEQITPELIQLRKVENQANAIKK
jgi:hypothetical protein